MMRPINLQLGWPTPRLFPSQSLATASVACLTDPKIASEALIYGPDLGYTPLRISVASWLSAFYNPPAGNISSKRILITGGASQNLASILHVFSDPIITQQIWMVEPVYFLACTIFQDAGFTGKMRGIRENDYGIDISFLRQSLEEFEAREKNTKLRPSKPQSQYGKIYRHILYITPTFSNPSAKAITNEVRQELLVLAREFDILIISDDVYDWLRWPADGDLDQRLLPVPYRFVDLDRATGSTNSWGNSISNGSFSKIVAPGVRVGWAEGTEKAILRLSQNGSTRSGGAPSHLTSTFLHQLLSSGAMQEHIDNVLIPTYSERYNTIMSSVTEYLSPLGVRVTTGASCTSATSESGVLPAGGFFTYISFPPELPSARVVAERALESYALTIAHGEIFVVKGDDSSLARSKGTWGNGARLCWAWEEEDAIREGIKRLAELVRVMLEESKRDELLLK